MPTVTVDRAELFRFITKEFTEEDFDQLCFDYGLEYDGQDVDEDGRVMYRVEVPANRYDLLCVEGLARALRVFLGLSKPLQFTLEPPTPNPALKMTAAPETATVRPFVFAAILRGLSFTPQNYKSFIDLQDKLHQNIARKRTLVAIGTHDLDTLKGPFTYEALPPEKIRFVPLNQTQEVDGNGMMSLLEGHQQLSTYLHIIRDSPLYPVIYDSNRVVLSVPPIINGDHSKITLNTKNVFIECTATDWTKGEIVLQTVAATFSQYSSKPFTIEPVLVEYSDGHPLRGGKCFVQPDLSMRKFTADVQYLQQVSGVPGLTAVRAVELLNKMEIPSAVMGETRIVAEVPITRSDVLHACDLAEDIAIAHGYNKLVITEFPSVKEQGARALEEQVRVELALCGYDETINWLLCSRVEACDYLRRKWRDPKAATTRSALEYDAGLASVEVADAKAKELEVTRTTLINGLLKTLGCQKAHELPIKMFEVGQCVVLDDSTETGARNLHRCAALLANNTGSGLEEVHGVLDVLMAKLQLRAEYAEFVESGSRMQRSIGKVYKLVPCDDSLFLRGRGVEIRVMPDNMALGVMGIVHPEVLNSFGVTLPCSIFEFVLEPFCHWLPETDLYDV